jgi:predicted DNA-binding transcriptional regulator YafY
MRASRLVNLLLLLQTRGGLTADELARELEVSVRTVHRDVEALSEAGIPIYAERGPQGGIRLVEGYRTRLTGMTAEEAEAVFLSGIPGPAAELGLGTVVAAARLKVLAALPAELRPRAARLVERFHLDASGWFQSDEPVPHLAALSEAVWGARRVEIGYRRGGDLVAGGDAVARVIDPLGLVLKAGVWYVVANVEGQVRTYRVSRVVSAQVLDETFERPARFDLPSWWAESSSAYEREAPRIEIEVRLRDDGLAKLADEFGNRAVRDARRLGEPDADGWQRLRLSVDWPAEAAGRMLRLVPDVEVLQPATLRDEIVGLARQALARYASA